MTKKPHILILGAGPAGLGAAFLLTRNKLAKVTVLEENLWVGGTAASFEIPGIKVDLGSHRLHPACDPEIMKDIKNLLGDELLDRPRHGRIRLHGRWIHFPLKPLDLAFRLPPSFGLGVMVDFIGKIVRRKSIHSEEETFESVLEAGLGKTIYRDFYLPYSRKIWGLKPDDLSKEQAYRRVSSNSTGKMLLKVLSALPGIKKPQGNGRFYYPLKGFGQICESLSNAAEKNGANIIMGASFKSLFLRGKKAQSVTYVQNNKTNSIEADFVWSTIPNTLLIQSIQPSPPDVIDASRKLEFRSMILIYLVLEQKQFSEYDAHYFPESEIPITRLSEPKNYNCADEPENITVLCAELPCFNSSPEWSMNDKELGELVCKSLELAKIPVKVHVNEVITRRIRYAYPLYQRGYKVNFNQVDQWLDQLDHFLTFGRQGLFAHDNTHHALSMAYSAVACFDTNDGFDSAKWKEFRKVFETYVVID
ncbi:MAG: protoporphyrinogen/coproporphyrinogen oxidase [Planctomycetota bacterium]|jgi:protoporphyrinogen oxidase